MPAKASAALRVPCRGGRPQCNLAPSLIRSYWSAVFSTFRGQHVADTQQPKRGERAVSNHLSTAQSLSFCLFWHRYYCAWYWEPTCIDCGGSLRPLSCKHLGWSWAGCRRRRPAQAAHVRVSFPSFLGCISLQLAPVHRPSQRAVTLGKFGDMYTTLKLVSNFAPAR